MVDLKRLTGIWSAAPTPLTGSMTVHKDDVRRMVDHHIRLGVNGLFLAGTNGEGPWLPEKEKRKLVRTAVEHSLGHLIIAVQVTDNSSARIHDNILSVQEQGADIAVIAPPNFFMNTKPANLKKHYIETIRKSPLPVGIYDRGDFGPVTVPGSVLKTVYAEKNVIMIKDSSMKPEHAQIALNARKKNPKLSVLNGYEFGCVEYLEMGYDGLLLGGGIFNGYLAGLILKAVQSGDISQAHRLQKRMNLIMYAVYGGKKISCWLAGEKKLLVEMGVFSTYNNFPNYSLTQSCIRNIQRVLEKDSDVLFP
ncbi:MAG: dihydrodipicolinate synthase family protein [Candidatus Latescibacteria bacterium]|nr:dihydrodipicolinate synthase family protein [Candidatus Latescibacterota bacterium]